MAIQLHRDQVNDQYWLMLKILIFAYMRSRVMGNGKMHENYGLYGRLS